MRGWSDDVPGGTLTSEFDVMAEHRYGYKDKTSQATFDMMSLGLRPSNNGLMVIYWLYPKNRSQKAWGLFPLWFYGFNSWRYVRQLHCHLTPEITCISFWEDCSPRKSCFAMKRLHCVHLWCPLLFSKGATSENIKTLEILWDNKRLRPQANDTRSRSS